MQSQMQCPVCTLYLHVGMNLQVHLDTHPKDQVIQALVNMTITQQQTNDNDLNTMQCSRYAPLLDEPSSNAIVVHSQTDRCTDAYPNASIGFYPEQSQATPPSLTRPPPPPPPPPPQPQQPPLTLSSSSSSSRHHQQVVIVNSCSTSVFREGSSHPSSSTSAQQIITNHIPITRDDQQQSAQPAAITAKPTSTNVTHLSPPPPYDYPSHFQRQINIREIPIVQNKVPSPIQTQPESRETEISDEIEYKSNEFPITIDVDEDEDAVICNDDQDAAIGDDDEDNNNNNNDDVFDSRNGDETMKIDVDDETFGQHTNDEDDDDTNARERPVRPNSVIHFNDFYCPGIEEPLLPSPSSSVVAVASCPKTPPPPASTSLPPPVMPMPIQIEPSKMTHHTGALQPYHSRGAPATVGQTPARRKSNFRILSNVKLDPIFDVFRGYALAARASTVPQPLLPTLMLTDDKDELKEEVFDLDATDGTMSLKVTDDEVAEQHADDDDECDVLVTMVPAVLSDLVRKHTMTSKERCEPDVVVAAAQEPIAATDEQSTQKPSELTNTAAAQRSILQIQQQPPDAVAPQATEPIAVPSVSAAVASTSRGATSVIRLASPKKKVTTVAELQVSSRPLSKAPFVKQPKKLVVKFKKPFVPVVEEEANLQPPDISPALGEPPCSDDDTSQDDAMVGSKDTNNILSCAEDFPFSPFRRSFTPVLLMISGVDDADAKLEKNEQNEKEVALTNSPHQNEPPAYPAKLETDIFRPTTPPSSSSSSSLLLDDNECPVDTVGHSKHQQPMVVVEGGSAIDQDENYMCDEKPPKIDLNPVVGGIAATTVMVVATAPNTEASSTITDGTTIFTIAMKTENVWSEPSTAAAMPFEVMPDACVADIYSASTSSHPTTSTSSSSSSAAHSFNNETPAGPSRIDYGLSSFLGYNDPGDGDDFYTGVNAIGFNTQETTYNWNRQFSPQYAPFESGEKNSYMDLDMCKNTSSYDERAPSTDSLNIRTDEKMPAKGEISEQESNGDVDGSWSHQNYPMQDNQPRYTSSYDTTVARESWSLRNDQTPRDFENISMVLPKFTPLDTTFPDNDDIKPPTADLLSSTAIAAAAAAAAAKLEKSKLLKQRKYRCPECPKVFSLLKEKRNHLVEAHNYEEKPWRSRITCTATSTSAAASATTTSTANTTTSITTNADDDDENNRGLAAPSTSADLALVKHESGTGREPRARMNRYLLNYNWNMLRQRLANQANGDGQDVKLPIPPSSSSNFYMCMVCHQLFTSIKAYDAHMSVHPAECYTCGRLFKHWINLNVHLKRHLNIRDYSCVHCSKKFVLRQNLLEHLNTHTGDTPLQCKICSKRFRRYSNLIQHRNRHHLKVRPKEKDFICYCGAVFHSEAKIAWHRETHDKKPKCCPYCRERFMHRNSLSRHVRLSHTERFGAFNGATVECTVCKKTYKKSSLKAHMASHAGKVEFGCNICDKGFTTKWNLKQHKWIHASRSSKPFKCTVCPKAFIREAEYTSHMNTHKSIKPYTCDHCGCQFARKYNWLRHTREHEKPKGFRCDDCGKVFHRAYYLTEHRRSHTGERPFECIICGKTSTTKTNHNKHVKIHHARDPLTAEG